MAQFLSGKLLIASPFLNDQNFLRSVVLIVNHDEEGAFGLSLNRPTGQRLSEILELSLPSGKTREDDFIYEGGPIQGPLLALHSLSGLGAPVDPESMDVWVTGEEEHLRMLLGRVDVHVRFVAHYSGWGPGQLDAELQAGGWLVGEGDAETVFFDAEQLWEHAVHRCGREILSSLSPGLRFHDPSVN
jgi:putative transcriptional regulator